MHYGGRVFFFVIFHSTCPSSVNSFTLTSDHNVFKWSWISCSVCYVTCLKWMLSSVRFGSSCWIMKLICLCNSHLHCILKSMEIIMHHWTKTCRCHLFADFVKHFFKLKVDIATSPVLFTTWIVSTNFMYCVPIFDICFQHFRSVGYSICFISVVICKITVDSIKPLYMIWSVK